MPALQTPTCSLLKQLLLAGISLARLPLILRSFLLPDYRLDPQTPPRPIRRSHVLTQRPAPSHCFPIFLLPISRRSSLPSRLRPPARGPGPRSCLRLISRSRPAASLIARPISGWAARTFISGPLLSLRERLPVRGTLSAISRLQRALQQLSKWPVDLGNLVN